MGAKEDVLVASVKLTEDDEHVLLAVIWGCASLDED